MVKRRKEHYTEDSADLANSRLNNIKSVLESHAEPVWPLGLLRVYVVKWKLLMRKSQ
jgi:hypothetical protein